MESKGNFASANNSHHSFSNYYQTKREQLKVKVNEKEKEEIEADNQAIEIYLGYVWLADRKVITNIQSLKTIPQNYFLCEKIRGRYYFFLNKFFILIAEYIKEGESASVYEYLKVARLLIERIDKIYKEIACFTGEEVFLLSIVNKEKKPKVFSSDLDKVEYRIGKILLKYYKLLAISSAKLKKIEESVYYCHLGEVQWEKIHRKFSSITGKRFLQTKEILNQLKLKLSSIREVPVAIAEKSIVENEPKLLRDLKLFWELLQNLTYYLKVLRQVTVLGMKEQPLAEFKKNLDRLTKLGKENESDFLSLIVRSLCGVYDYELTVYKKEKLQQLAENHYQAFLQELDKKSFYRKKYTATRTKQKSVVPIRPSTEVETSVSESNTVLTPTKKLSIFEENCLKAAELVKKKQFDQALQIYDRLLSLAEPQDVIRKIEIFLLKGDYFKARWLHESELSHQESAVKFYREVIAYGQNYLLNEKGEHEKIKAFVEFAELELKPLTKLDKQQRWQYRLNSNVKPSNVSHTLPDNSSTKLVEVKQERKEEKSLQLLVTGKRSQPTVQQPLVLPSINSSPRTDLKMLPELKIFAYFIDIPPDILHLNGALESYGFSTFIVGGAVRDAFLGRSPREFDLVTSATPPQILMLLVSLGFTCKVVSTQNFPHVLVLGYQQIVFAKPIEVNTLRQAPAIEATTTFQYDTNGMIILNAAYGNDLAADVLNRDLYIDMYYYHHVSGFIYQYFQQSFCDLQNRKINLLGEPHRRFTEDPLRILRLIEKATRLDFQLGPGLGEAILSYAHRLKQVPPNRMLGQIVKLFCYGKAVKNFSQLRQYQLVGILFPGLQSLEKKADADRIIDRLMSYLDDEAKKLLAPSQTILFAVLLWPALIAKVDPALSTPEAFTQATIEILNQQGKILGFSEALQRRIKALWEKVAGHPLAENHLTYSDFIKVKQLIPLLQRLVTLKPVKIKKQRSQPIKFSLSNSKASNCNQENEISFNQASFKS